MSTSVPSLYVIDDFEPDAVMAKIVLGRNGRFPHVETFPGAEEVLALFDAAEAQDATVFPPQVILLDINMPGMDGFEFLDALTARLPARQADAIAVIMLTSSTRSTDRGRAEAYPMVKGFETKPLTAAAAERIADRFGHDA